MKLYRLITFIFSIVIFSAPLIYSQEIKQDTLSGNKNVVHGAIGFVPIYAVANISYERKIAENSDRFLRSYWAKASAGLWGAWAVGGSVYSSGVTALTGSRKSHLELNIGFVLFYDRMSYQNSYYDNSSVGIARPPKSDFLDFSLAGGIGYRYQGPKEPIVFRIGISYPESIYLGVGYSF